MMILQMQATFGKLENEKLCLRQGLNIIQRPNESGKSTWCAFLTAMLYGVETKARSKKDGTLAVKEQYAPWNGQPMSGTMEILWQGRRLRLQRTADGRRPMAKFQATDLETGSDVQDLTGETCGQTLLGVSRDIFVRSAFVGQGAMRDVSRMEQTQLQDRLRQLAATGEDDFSYQAAEQRLKDWKNKCRVNSSTGEIPAVQRELEELRIQLQQLGELHQSAAALQSREQQLTCRMEAMQAQMQERSAQRQMEKRRQLQQMEQQAKQDAAVLQQLQAQTADFPAPSCLMEWQAQLLTVLPPEPEAPEEVPDAQAEQDAAIWQALSARRPQRVWPLAAAAALLAICTAVLAALGQTLPAAAAAALLVGAVLWLLTLRRSQKQTAKKLQSFQQTYGVADAAALAAKIASARQASAQYEAARSQAEAARRAAQALEQTVIQALPGLAGTAPERCRQALALQEQLRTAQQTAKRTQEAAAAMQAVAGDLESAVYLEEAGDQMPEYRSTKQELAALSAQRQHIEGRLEAAGGFTPCVARSQMLEERLERLEEFRRAAELALSSLAQAAESLRGRLSPQLVQRTEAYLGKMTCGAYRTVSLDENLAASLPRPDAPESKPLAFFSRGTMEQLYLSLRLAVADLLAPDAPLILDDALVAFDDGRLTSALELLQEIAAHRQVLLFTCQSREAACLDGTSAEV